MQNLFETNFMLTLKNVFINGIVHMSNDDCVIGLRGVVYHMTDDDIPLLQVSKISENTLNEVVQSANQTIKKISIDNLESFHDSCCGCDNWIRFTKVNGTLNMIGSISRYDMIRDNIKPMLECFFILKAVAQKAGLQYGTIDIITGVSFIKEDDETIASELLHRISYISDKQTIQKLYIEEGHEDNYQEFINDIQNMNAKLDELEILNKNDNRDFSNAPLPLESINAIMDMSESEVDDFIKNARESFKQKYESFKLMDRIVTTNWDFFENIEKFSGMAPGLKLEVVDGVGRLEIEGVEFIDYSALRSILG